MRPRSSEAARLDGYELHFDTPGLPLVEPGFANVRPAPAGTVYGVLYRLEPSQLRTLDLMEGGGQAYRHIEVEVDGSERGRVVARTYSSLARASRVRPSLRYLNILLGGARAHDLPDHWQRRIATWPAAPHVPVLSDALASWLPKIERWHLSGKSLVPLLAGYWRTREWLLRRLPGAPEA